MEPAAYESVSSWSQPDPPDLSPVRRALLADLAARVVGIRPGHVRVVVDGRTAAGKTSFGHELARAVRALGRPTLRASLDDFKHPWAHAQENGYDRTSGEGYYRNPWDVASIRELLLDPMAPDGDGVFALRPAYDDAWDLRIWLDVDAATSLDRGVGRDGADALAVHRDRYAAAEEIYLAEVDPVSRANVVIDNSDLARPVVRG